MAVLKWRRFTLLCTFAGLIVMIALLIPASSFASIFLRHSDVPFGSMEAFTLFLMPSIAFILVALLVFAGLNLGKEARNSGKPEGSDERSPRKHAALAMATPILITLLLAKALQRFYWLIVWDKTSDSLGFLWLFFPILAAAVSGVILSILLPVEQKRIGPGYALILAILMNVIFTSARQVDFRQLTAARAERVSQAIDRYYAREGHYPQDLNQLIPRYLLSQSEPVMIFGQGWCYNGGDDYYQFGYLSRQHWSDPRLSGLIYSARGAVPNLRPLCEQEFAAIQARYPEYPFTYWVDGK